jgi:type I restriction enzyme S subunit
VQIPVPPLEEQLRIASVLRNIDKYTKVNQEIVSSSETIRVGTAERLFRYYNDETTTHPMIGEYPAEWDLFKLSDVCEVVDAEHFTPDYVDDGIPLIRPGDMREEIISLDEVQKSVSEDTYDEMTRRHTPTNEDVLYSRSQNFAIASVVDTDHRFCIGQDMVAIKPNDVERDFLRHLMNSPLIRDQAKRRSTGTTFSRINLGDIRDLEVPIPSSEVQSEISEKLNVLEKYREMSQSAVEYSSVIAEGLAERLISGEIRTDDKQIEVSEKVRTND